MSVTAIVITQEQTVEQIKDLHHQRDQLQIQLEQLERKLKMIESSLAENEELKVKVKVLLEASTKLFLEEWKRKHEYFPEIHLASVLDEIAVLNPAK